MNKHYKEKWLAALRSGKYKQARGVLRGEAVDGSGVGYCCLGVLVDACGFGDDLDCWRDAGTIPMEDPCDIDEHGQTEFNEGDLSDWVLRAVGLDGDDCSELVAMNDGLRMSSYDYMKAGKVTPEAFNDREFKREPQSFDAIAEFIEEHL